LGERNVKPGSPRPGTLTIPRRWSGIYGVRIRRDRFYAFLGFVIGVAFAGGFGSAYDQPLLGMAVGILLGIPLAIGLAAFSHWIDRRRGGPPPTESN
jgi:hypothetical protein